MEPFDLLTSAVAPLLEDDINNTDIAGGRGPGGNDNLGDQFFSRRRWNPDGSENSSFILNRREFRSAKILVTGSNYGCGSSSESSVWVPVAFGIRCIVARSFADIYRENCLRKGILPIVLDAPAAADFEATVVAVDGAEAFTVDLEHQRIAGAGHEWSFAIAAGEKKALLTGRDEIEHTLEYGSEIGAFEVRASARAPWLQRVELAAS
jgi:3-isopropylmalate/(R)-2-methylmalate dehydratase small subunit